MNTFEFDIGDSVIPIAPKYKVDFLSGWSDVMERFVGREAVVTRRSDHSGAYNSYRLDFGDGRTWWWDEDCVQPASSVPGITAEQFDEILFSPS